MPIASMTGFARGEGTHGECAWTWEIRSVNGRGLEVRLRLPAGFEGLEPAVRQRVSAALKRGSVTVTLNLMWTRGQAGVRINQDVLQAVIALVPQIRAQLPDCAAPSVDGLLGLRGVIDVEDTTPTGEARTAFEAALLVGLEGCLAQLLAVRRSEGERLGGAIRTHIDRIADLTEQAARQTGAQPSAILARLQEQVQLLLDAVPALTADRLAQEATLLAVKADPREELDRLRAHCQAARGLMTGDGAIGRQLDFLCQEFNREANTLCSKSADVELTRVGLDLKITIDQLREQVQNLE